MRTPLKSYILNTLSPDDRTASERLGSMVILEEVRHWGGLRGTKASHHHQRVLCFLLVRGELAAPAPTECYHVFAQSSWTPTLWIPKSNSTLLSWGVIVIVFYQSSQKSPRQFQCTSLQQTFTLVNNQTSSMVCYTIPVSPSHVHWGHSQPFLWDTGCRENKG